MRNRIPAEEAFQYYLALGPRSYDQVAAKYEVSCAASGGRQQAGASMPARSRGAEKPIAPSPSKAETRERHLKMLKAIESQGLIALCEVPNRQRLRWGQGDRSGAQTRTPDPRRAERARGHFDPGDDAARSRIVPGAHRRARMTTATTKMDFSRIRLRKAELFRRSAAPRATARIAR